MKAEKVKAWKGQKREPWRAAETGVGPGVVRTPDDPRLEFVAYSGMSRKFVIEAAQQVAAHLNGVRDAAAWLSDGARTSFNKLEFVDGLNVTARGPGAADDVGLTAQLIDALEFNRSYDA